MDKNGCMNGDMESLYPRPLLTAFRYIFHLSRTQQQNIISFFHRLTTAQSPSSNFIIWEISYHTLRVAFAFIKKELWPIIHPFFLLFHAPLFSDCVCVVYFTVLAGHRANGRGGYSVALCIAYKTHNTTQRSIKIK